MYMTWLLSFFILGYFSSFADYKCEWREYIISPTARYIKSINIPTYDTYDGTGRGPIGP